MRAFEKYNFHPNTTLLDAVKTIIKDHEKSKVKPKTDEIQLDLFYFASTNDAQKLSVSK